jgi:hypothetical protein
MAPQVGLEPTTLRLTVASSRCARIHSDCILYNIGAGFGVSKVTPIHSLNIPIYTVSPLKNHQSQSRRQIKELAGSRELKLFPVGHEFQEFGHRAWRSLNFAMQPLFVEYCTKLIACWPIRNV